MCKKELGLKPRLASFVVLIRLQGRRNALAIVGLHILWFSINQPPLRWIFDKAFDAQTEIINDRLFDALQVDTSRHALTQLSCDTSMDIYIYIAIYILYKVYAWAQASRLKNSFSTTRWDLRDLKNLAVLIEKGNFTYLVDFKQT